MAEQTVSKERPSPIPGLDREAAPLLGIGLGLTGLALGLRPRLAPVPLALTALAAALYRNPERLTPQVPGAVFAPADGAIVTIDEVYEHRFLHTDCLRLTIIAAPIDVPICRSPGAGTIRYLEHVSGEFRPVQDALAAERNERLYIGIDTDWGPLLLLQIAGPFARRISCHVQAGEAVEPGERLSTLRFGARTDLLVQRDALHLLVQSHQHVVAGLTRIADLVSA
ncbi:MAG: phosphatidylserine decarboxylase [Oscillochloris sp.]|nr:phosphatidylserine decarboxylase [Oscillochloris sp.]